MEGIRRRTGIDAAKKVSDLNEKVLMSWAEKNNIEIDGGQLSLLSAYQNRVLEVNEHMNLTAITGDENFTVKHFIDSLTLLPWLPQNAKVIDVGTGAGFPGVPLKIMRPDVGITLMDSLRKRVYFLRESINLLCLENVCCVHARAEEFVRKPDYREQYDICAARAVARLSVLAGYTLPFVKRGGLLLAMKGPDAAEEIAEAAPIIKRLRAEIKEVKPVEIAEGITHTVIVIEK